MSKVGSPENPLRVAIIGAGPAGFYTASSLLKRKDLCVQTDMFDGLPSPFGLVRTGVAPDHQKIKGVTRVYEKIAAHEGFRFFGNLWRGVKLFVNFGSSGFADGLLCDLVGLIEIVGLFDLLVVFVLAFHTSNYVSQK